MLDVLAISLGAVLGANARYFLTRLAVRLLGPAFPYSTLAINVSGSFVLGFFLAWTTERVLVDPRWRLFAAVGFCGGFTTFSSYAYESVVFVEQGQWTLLVGNVLSNNLLSLGAVVAGIALARLL